MPDRPSLPLKDTVTLELFQPFAFGPGEALALAVGAVLSMLIPLTVAGALTLPALSLQVPEADCPAPSLLSVTGALQLAIPDRASEPLKLTTTSVSFQPFAFGPGEALALAVGAVASRLMVTD
jgi:hypothetical protein